MSPCSAQEPLLRSDRCPQRLPFTTVNGSSRERCWSRRTLRLSSPWPRRKPRGPTLYSGCVAHKAARVYYSALAPGATRGVRRSIQAAWRTKPHTGFGVGLPSWEIASKRIPEFGWERLALVDHDLMGRDWCRGVPRVAGKFWPGDRGD